MKSVTYESEGEGALVSEQTKQVSSSLSRDWGWVDREVWTERMLAALENGVRGGKWFSLIDKVYDLRTLQRAWAGVRARDGAAGVDGQSCAQSPGVSGDRRFCSPSITGAAAQAV